MRSMSAAMESTSGSSSTTSIVSVGFDDDVAMALLSGYRERTCLESDYHFL